MKIREFIKKNKEKLWISSAAQKLLDKVSDEDIQPVELQGNISTEYLTDTKAMKECNMDFMSLDEAFASMFSLIEKQLNGEKGTLQTNGSGNIVYVKHSGGRASVCFYWDDGLWRVSADGFGDEWLDGRCFFSRKSLKSSETGNLDSMTLESAIKICKENGLKVIRSKVVEEEL